MLKCILVDEKEIGKKNVWTEIILGSKHQSNMNRSKLSTSCELQLNNANHTLTSDVTINIQDACTNSDN